MSRALRPGTCFDGVRPVRATPALDVDEYVDFDESGAGLSGHLELAGLEALGFHVQQLRPSGFPSDSTDESATGAGPRLFGTTMTRSRADLMYKAYVGQQAIAELLQPGFGH